MNTLLGGLFVFGALGLAAELLLLEHYEGAKQWIPLILLGLGLLLGLGTLVQVRQSAGQSAGGASIRALRILGTALVVAGGLGVYFHLTGNREFVVEVYPSSSGTDLAWRSLRGAFPALAPGALLQLGLLGWLWSLSLHRSRSG